MSQPPVSSARVPAPLTPLIGRDGRVDAAWQALHGTRLLTLIGPGGSGKTRLAIELASRGESSAWVELAPLDDPRLLAAHVAAALGVPGRAGKPALPHIVERFAARPMILVLDNCEHLVDAVAGFVGQLLRECAVMKVLATSREALGVAGERTIAVPPLSIPRDDSLDSARDADAIALFLERAQDVRAGFELNARNAAAIARICRRLDGIPLAIELAAARVRALDPEQLAQRLESSIGLLETGSRAALPRHRTIRDTIDWSYRLLSDEERVLLSRVSVFHGTFSLDAVEAVCSNPGATCAAVLDVVTALLDKSLISCDVGDAGTRYRLLETVREYAAERLREAGETESVRERHARFFLSLAEHAAPALFFVGDETWLARLDEEATNLRDAHNWCEQQTARLELSLRMSVALHWYWYARGRFSEGRLRLGIALAFSEGVSPLLRGRALAVLSRLAGWQGDFASVHAPAEEAVTLLAPLGDCEAHAYALLGLGVAATLQQRLPEARDILEDAADALGNDVSVLRASIEYWKGLIAQWSGDAAGARAAFERALAIGRRLNRRVLVAHSQSVLGRHLAEQGALDAARSALQEALSIFREIDDRWGLVRCLHGLARVAVGKGATERGAALLGAAEVIRDDLSLEFAPPDREYHDTTIAAALKGLGEAAFWSAWADGKKRPLAETITAALLPDPTAVEAEIPTATATAPAIDLRMRALGAYEAYVRGRRVEKTEWGSSRARELLAFLACHPDGCTKAQIGLALWPDASPGQLRNTFHVTLHRLRNALAVADAIQVEGDRYKVNPSLAREFDAELFERDARGAMRELRRGGDAADALAEAVARYRGDFLAGESVGEWAHERRDRLHQLHLEALEALGRAQMARERFAEAADAFRALLEADPVNEEACRRQMICLSSLGDRAAALRAYETLARALRDELGVGPERETASLRDKLVSTT